MLNDDRLGQILNEHVKLIKHGTSGGVCVQPQSILKAVRAAVTEAVKEAAAVERERPPMQLLALDLDGVLRFKANAIVRFLLDAGPFDMNQLALMNFEPEDREQFAQLIGYSLSGYGDLSYVSDGAYERAERAAGDVLARGEGNDAER